MKNKFCSFILSLVLCISSLISVFCSCPVYAVSSQSEEVIDTFSLIDAQGEVEVSKAKDYFNQFGWPDWIGDIRYSLINENGILVPYLNVTVVSFTPENKEFLQNLLSGDAIVIIKSAEYSHNHLNEIAETIAKKSKINPAYNEVYEVDGKVLIVVSILAHPLIKNKMYSQYGDAVRVQAKYGSRYSVSYYDFYGNEVEYLSEKSPWFELWVLFSCIVVIIIVIVCLSSLIKHLKQKKKQ